MVDSQVMPRAGSLEPGAAGGTNSRRGDFLLAAAIVLLTLAVFSPVLGHHFIESCDDSSAILTNRDYLPPTLGRLLHYWKLPAPSPFYVPVTYTLWGLLAMVARHSPPPALPFNPVYFYAANWLSHALAAGLAFLCLRQLIQWRPAAFVGALLFAMHPIQVEGVANAWSVYTPLSGMFVLAALWQYLIFSQRRFGERVESPGSRGNWRYAAASALFILGILTKPQVVTLPLVAAAIEWFWRRRSPRQLLPLAPWLILGLLDVWANRLTSTSGAIYRPVPWILPLVPLNALGSYLRLFLWPNRLTFDYSLWPQWVIEHYSAWAVGLPPIVLGIIAWRLRNRWPWLITGMAISVAGLLPTLGLVAFDYQRLSTTADRYAYLAVLGPALLLAVIVQRLARTRWRFILWPATGAMLLVLAGLSVRQLGYWRDDWTMAAHMTEANPRSNAAISSFRYLFTSRGHYDSPTAPFPASSHCTLDRATLVRVGDILRQRHYFFLAQQIYIRAIAKGPPTAALYDLLGDDCTQYIEPDAAAAAYQAALSINPRDVSALTGLGQSDLSLGRYPQAIEQFQKALSLRPDERIAQRGLKQAQAYEAENPAATKPAKNR